MLSRYLSAIVIGLLVSAWLIAAAFSAFYLVNSRDLADGVATGTATYQGLFKEANQEKLEELKFPRGRVFRLVQQSWADRPTQRGYPNGIIAPPTQASTIARPTGAAPARRRLGPRR